MRPMNGAQEMAQEMAQTADIGLMVALRSPERIVH